MAELHTHPQISHTHTFLKAENISAHYGDTAALMNLTLHIPANRITVLIGPSGCGKSTLLRCFNGLVKISSGHIEYEDESIRALSETNLRRNMGYVIQSIGLMPHMTVEENVDLVPRLLGWERASRKERVARLLQLVRLDPDIYQGKYPNELSGGEAQRVGVARALGADPPVLLMDEPFGAVDPLTREKLQNEFIRIHRQLKKTVIFVTHDIDEAIRLADYLVIMKDGKIIQADTPENVLADPANEFVEQFLGPNRSLKRLTLFTADHCMVEAASGTDANAEAYLDPETPGCYWKVDSNGIPLSGYAWIQGKIIERPITTSAHTVQKYSSLRECMSNILSLGLPAAAVVDGKGRLCGEVLFETIQKISIS